MGTTFERAFRLKCNFPNSPWSLSRKSSTFSTLPLKTSLNPVRLNSPYGESCFKSLLSQNLSEVATTFQPFIGFDVALQRGFLSTSSVLKKMLPPKREIKKGRGEPGPPPAPPPPPH